MGGPTQGAWSAPWRVVMGKSQAGTLTASPITLHALSQQASFYLFTLGAQRFAKRAMDIVAASLAVLVLLPVFMVVAMAIRIDTRGPIFFRQERIGRGGRAFRMWKFRSMVTDAEKRLSELQAQNEGNGPFFKMSNDPRVTAVGRLLRRTSVDELPQLFNVLRGEMSLVGPRPFLRDEYEAAPELFRWRLGSTPGITGPWQVAGCSKVPLEQAVELDRNYALNWNLLVDLRILFATSGAVVRNAIDTGVPKAPPLPLLSGLEQHAATAARVAEGQPQARPALAG